MDLYTAKQFFFFSSVSTFELLINKKEGTMDSNETTVKTPVTLQFFFFFERLNKERFHLNNLFRMNCRRSNVVAHVNNEEKLFTFTNAFVSFISLNQICIYGSLCVCVSVWNTPLYDTYKIQEQHCLYVIHLNALFIQKWIEMIDKSKLIYIFAGAHSNSIRTLIYVLYYSQFANSLV